MKQFFQEVLLFTQENAFDLGFGSTEKSWLLDVDQ
jgi:hypothetical protein